MSEIIWSEEDGVWSMGDGELGSWERGLL